MGSAWIPARGRVEIGKVVQILAQWMKDFQRPAGSRGGLRRDPFRILISCMLSLRTKDGVTAEASSRLFSLASTPQSLAAIPLKKVEKAIYPVGFYRTKAKNIRVLCRKLVEEYGCRVPQDLDRLLELPGVGRKTANLVQSLGFGKPAICVDTHVHRICNRWGYVSTKTPNETELVLRGKLPRKHWISFNGILVPFGQNICKPVSPFCTVCRVEKYCPRIGVVRSR